MNHQHPMLAESVDEILEGVHPGWLPFIDRKLLTTALGEIDALGDSANIMPEKGLVFEWLRYFGPDDMVGGITGQDPYPTDAIGLCFAKRATAGMPESFKPIVKCLEKQSLMKPRTRRHADIRPWAARGLLATNMALTTRAGKSKVHQKIWKPLMTEFFTRLCKYAKDHKIPLFFLCWGVESRNGLGAIAKRFGHAVFEWSHPSPMSDNQIRDESKKFMNCTNFADANQFLIKNQRRPFSWDHQSTLMAFVDGACSGNGKADATGGFGVLVLGGQFGRTTIREMLRPTLYEFIDSKHPEMGFRSGENEIPITNNRAELLALCWAFLVLLRGFAFGEIEVFSDSDISVKTFNEWLPKRRKLGTAHELQNQDLIIIGEALMNAIRPRVLKLTLSHVNASHDAALKKNATDREKLTWGGNDTVDKLAKAAKEDHMPLEIVSPMPVIRALIALSPETSSAST